MDTRKAMFTRRTFLEALAFVGASSLVTGCASGGQTTGDSTSASASNGYMLSCALSGEPATLDPAYASDHAAIQVMAQVYETLLRFEEGSCKLVPCLADLPKVSDDGLTYTFAIRKGITFHDGSTFDATAAKQNIERQLEPNRTDNMPFANLAYGSEQGKDGVASVEAPDANTLVIKLRAANAAFANNMAMCVGVSMVAPSAFKTAAEHPVGTGPFAFGEWQKGDAILLERNDAYWNTEDVAKANGLIMRFITDADARATALKDGDIDIVDDLNKNMANIVAGGGSTTVGTPGTGLRYLAFNVQSPTLKEQPARAALCKALDVPTIVESSLGVCAEYARTIIPPYMITHLNGPQYVEFYAQAAKSELAKAGVSKVSCIVNMGANSNDEEANKALAEAMVAFLAKAGVTMSVEALQTNEFKQRVEAGSYDMCVASCMSRNGDALPLVQPLASQDPITNVARFASEDYNKLLASAATKPAGAERANLFAQCEKIVSEQAIWLPLCYTTGAIAQAAHVSGTTVSVLGPAYLTGAAK